MSDTLKAPPRSGVLGAIADALVSARRATGWAGDFFLGEAPEAFDKLSYGEPLLRGKGFTTSVTPEALALASLIPIGKPLKNAEVAANMLKTYRVGGPGIFYGTTVKDGVEKLLPRTGDGVKTFTVGNHGGAGHGAPLADAVDGGLISVPKMLADRLGKYSPGDGTWDTDLLGALLEHGRGAKVLHFAEPADASKVVSVDLTNFDRNKALQEFTANLQRQRKGDFPFASANWQTTTDAKENRAVLDILKALP